KRRSPLVSFWRPIRQFSVNTSRSRCFRCSCSTRRSYSSIPLSQIVLASGFSPTPHANGLSIGGQFRRCQRTNAKVFDGSSRLVGRQAERNGETHLRSDADFTADGALLDDLLSIKPSIDASFLH